MNALQLIRLVPGALILAVIAYGWLWMFEILDMITTTLQQGS